MLLKKCALCGKLIAYGGRYCPACIPKAEQEAQARQRRADEKRKDKVTAFYRSAAWLKLSRAYLQAKEYRCERCGRIAECVHHKHYIRSPGGWDRRLEWDNLEALCGECHAIEHGRKRGGRNNANPGVGEKV